MLEIIKPGTKFPIITHSNKMLFLSSMLVIGSIILLVVKGLNLGIDFRGGNKLIVSFDSQVEVERDAIRDVVHSVIAESNPTSQIEVQGFESTDKTQKYQIFVEATSLLSDEQAASIKENLEAKLAANEGTTPEKVIRPKETDKYVIALKEATSIASTKALIRQIVSNPRCCESSGACTAITSGSAIKVDENAGTCEIPGASVAGKYQIDFPQMEVTSDEERNLDMDFYKEYNLRVLEFQKEGQPLADDDFEQEKLKFQKRAATILETRPDKNYTVSLQQFQTKVQNALQAQFGKADDGSWNVQVDSATSVSPSVGQDLFNKGMVAILYAIIGILIYIGFRFDFRYSPGAVAALLHDTILTLGVFSLFGVKFTLPIIAALLTIIGYSLNDTIVVYDRIRENLVKFKGMDLSKLVNQSINETLSRTLLTSFTTLFVVVALMVWGGGLIKDFAFALTIGVAVGTYSSVFIASPLVIKLDAYFAGRQAKASSSASPAKS